MRADTRPLEAVTRELDLRSAVPFIDSEAQLQQMLAIARHVEFPRGTRLFERGAPLAHVYMIMEGEVDLVPETGPTWRISAPGGIGFLDFMVSQAHTRTAVAMTDIRTVEIDAADYREYMQDHVDLSHRVLTSLSDGLLDEIFETPDPAVLLARRADGQAQPDGAEPTVVDRMILLQRAPAFAGASVQALANLARGAVLVRAPAGQVIAAAGLRAETVSVLVRGEVELTAPGKRFVALRGPIDLMGHIAELSTAPRPLTVRAVRDSLILQIHREELLDRIDEHFELLQTLLAYVSKQRERFNDAKASRKGEV